MRETAVGMRMYVYVLDGDKRDEIQSQRFSSNWDQLVVSGSSTFLSLALLLLKPFLQLQHLRLHENVLLLRWWYDETAWVIQF